MPTAIPPPPASDITGLENKIGGINEGCSKNNAYKQNLLKHLKREQQKYTTGIFHLVSAKLMHQCLVQEKWLQFL